MRCFDTPARRKDPGAPALVLVLVTMLMAIASLTVRAAPPPTKHGGRAHTVTIEGMRYSPQILRVHRGDRITWINKDPFPHTVTATDGTFDSQPIAAGGSWTYVTQKAGEYAYVCKLHVDMKGTLQVR